MEEGIDWTPSKFVVEEDDGELDFSTSGTGERWIKNTSRHFIMCDEYMDFCKGHTLFLHLKAAWYINAEELQAVCQEYLVDMKIEAYERGMEFGQLVEIINGEIKKNEDIEYADYEWDCPCPTLGG
jgi:hypothetical protein